jgi:hypothetical protein
VKPFVHDDKAANRVVNYAQRQHVPAERIFVVRDHGALGPEPVEAAMRRVVAIALLLCLAIASASPALAGKKKKKKPKPVATTLYLHGKYPDGALDGFEFSANGTNSLTMDPSEPSGTLKSMWFTHLFAVTDCTSNPVWFPTWVGELSGTVVGDAKLTASFLSNGGKVTARIWSDTELMKCLEEFVLPAAEVTVDVPDGQNEVEIVFETLNIPVEKTLLVQLLDATPGHEGRVLYDGTGAESRFEFDCLPATGVSACTP